MSLLRLPGTLTQKINGVLAVFFTIVLLLSGYALWITHQLEGGAAAINEAGAQRMRTYRIAHLLNQAVNDPERRPVLLSEVENALYAYEAVLRTLSQGDPARPLFLPAQGPVRTQMERVQSFWDNEIAPLFHQTVSALQTPFIDPGQTLFLFRNLDETVRRYVSEVNQLVSEIEKWNAHHTQQLWWLLNGFIATVLIGAILLLTYFRHLVIKPLTILHRGIERMTSADFDVRLPTEQRDEFGDVARGFNRMADELRALYATLEERVQEKTKALEERARELSVLYEIAATTAQPENIAHLVHAVLSRTANLVGAQGWMVRLNQPSERALTLIASEGLSQWEQSCANTIGWEECLCGQAAAYKQTLAGCPTSSMANGQLPFCLRHHYFVVAIPFLVKHRVIGLFSLLFAHHRTLSAGEQRLLETIGHHLAVAIENQLLAEREKEMAVTEERQLLAQELHDSIAQSLAYLNLQVQMLAQSIADGNLDQAKSDLALIREGIQESYDTVRELLVSFRIRIDHHDLCEALRSAALRFEGQTGIVTRVQCQGVIGHLAPSTLLQLLHIVQEALSNVRKHARASAVTVTCSGTGETIVLEVADNGIGFDPQQLPKEDSDHVGIHIMRERARRIGAHFTLSSSLGQGTTITLRLPRSPSDASHEQ